MIKIERALISVSNKDGLAEKLRELTIALYERGAEVAAERGIIVADTKFEFGFAEGELILIDEVLTPDSSRFWPADRYEPGRSPESFDKQFIRDYLETVDWDKTPPGPVLPDAVIQASAERYVEAYERLIDPAHPLKFRPEAWS